MSDDILKSVSQRGYGAYDAENRRIKEISDELQRLCRLHEERAAEQYAKSVGMWIPMDEVFDLGTPGPSGNENDTYVAKDTIFKVNNLLNKVMLHPHYQLSGLYTSFLLSIL